MTTKPAVHSLDDLEEHAALHLPKMVRDYFNGGALDSVTLRANKQEYQKWYIQPRVLRDASTVKTETRVFSEGNNMSFPCCIAPAAMQRIAHPDGEEATARACGRFGTVMGLSTFATTSLEDVKTAADDAREEAGMPGPSECVLQLYLFENREASKTLIRRAESMLMGTLGVFAELTGTEVGYKAIVLTVDTPYFGRRLTEIRNSFRLPPHLRMANFDASMGVKTGSEHRTDENQAKSEGKPVPSKINAPPANKIGMTIPANSSTFWGDCSLDPDASLTWDAVKYLKGLTNLPIWLKGIMTEEDALLAVEHGADAIYISNHGGRQLDGAPPTLRVLEKIAKAVDKRIPVHFDGGVRRGSDIFKALCLGADMVWIGRPALWGLAYDGEHGVVNALRLLEDEFKACMGLAGCRSREDLRPEALMRVEESRL